MTHPALRALFSLMLLAPVLFGASREVNPFGAQAQAVEAGKKRSAGEIRKIIDSKIPTASTAFDFCYIAELMKRIGDYSAVEYYEKAIAADADEPAYELFYGEYLRNFRGPRRPLFPRAEQHFYAGKVKLRRAEKTPELRRKWDGAVGERLDRALVALYERDGLPLIMWNSDPVDKSESVQRPFAFLSTGVRAERATADLDRTSDVRDRTSEALFAQSRFRLNRPLIREELRGILRVMRPIETQDRLRFRYRGAPSVDVLFNYRDTANAQITNFYRPTLFNGLTLADYGVAAERPFSLGNQLDVNVGGAYHRVRRVGLIEFLPDARENIDQAEARGTLSRFAGPDKVNADFVFVRQNIHPNVRDQRDRDRSIYAGTFTYQIFRSIPRLGRSLEDAYGRRFETRGIDLTAGILHDEEDYPGGLFDTTVVRRDYFVGVNVRGIGRLDFGIQPTWFTSKVSNDASQFNSQYRTAGNALFRIVDEERNPGLPKARLAGMRLAFLHLVVPFRHDVARKGLDAYENYRVGVRMHAKWFSTARGALTFLGHAGYDYQNFHVVQRSFHLFTVGLSLGF
jgi:hypothetical protein